MARTKQKSQYITADKPDGAWASYPALPINQNKHRFYIVTIPREDIFPFCFVARRDEDAILGFQRNLNSDRARDIANYLDDSKGSIPTNIVLSAQESAELEYNTRNKTLRYRCTAKAFLVLDGQHRLFGYGQTKRHHRVPVAIYEGLTRKDEASLFIDINTNQRGVPASLLLDIKEVAQRENQREQYLRQLFTVLNTSPDSPLNGFLATSEGAKNKITRRTFYRAMEPIVEDVVLQKLTVPTQHKLIQNYFRALDSTLKRSAIIRKSAYFEAFCALFPDVVKIAAASQRNYKYETLLETLAPLQNVDLESIPTGGSTKLSKTRVLQVLKQTLLSHLPADEDMV
jgi:DNA sulfur modification protein DndB